MRTLVTLSSLVLTLAACGSTDAPTPGGESGSTTSGGQSTGQTTGQSTGQSTGQNDGSSSESGTSDAAFTVEVMIGTDSMVEARHGNGLPALLDAIAAQSHYMYGKLAPDTDVSFVVVRIGSDASPRPYRRVDGLSPALTVHESGPRA